MKIKGLYAKMLVTWVVRRLTMEVYVPDMYQKSIYEILTKKVKVYMVWLTIWRFLKKFDLNIDNWNNIAYNINS